MASSENILAVRLGPTEQLGMGVDTGLRALLAVNFIVADTATYTCYGQSLYMIHYDVGQLSVQDSFAFFCRQFYNKPFEWNQLSAPPPNPLLQNSRVYLIPVPQSPPPVAFGTMTLLEAGYDPLTGYWLQFDGNYDLTCPLFSGFNGVRRNTPNYQIRIG